MAARAAPSQAGPRSEARAAYAAPAPPLANNTALPSGARAEATGTFDGTHEALLRDQPHGDQTGNDVLTPLRLADGTTVLVDRGWVGATDDIAAPPSGPVVVRGVLADGRTLSAQDSIETTDGRVSVPRVDLTRLSTVLKQPLRGQWLQARFIAPNVANAPVLPQPPPPDQVNHLQYTFEWFALALIPLLGWPIVLYRARRKRGNGSPVTRAPVRHC